MKRTINGFIIAIVAVMLIGTVALSFIACGDDNGSVAPTITTVSLPDGVVGTAYSQTLAATGDASITWSKESGEFPDGLTLADNGTISGTPTTVGKSDFTVKATNAAGSDTKELSITIAENTLWWYYVVDDSTATLEFSIGDNDVVTAIVGGIPEIQWNRWKTMFGYPYSGAANTAYVYKIEAWTKPGDGDRTFSVQYYENSDEGIYIYEDITITETKKTYTIRGQSLPGDESNLRFHCADQLGTFYVKILEIREMLPGEELPENWSVEERWSSWVNNDSTATLDHFSVNSEGEVTITVGGAPDESWHLSVNYLYTVEVGKSYTYKFEAWTAPGEGSRGMNFLHYYDEQNHFTKWITINEERKSYTVSGDVILVNNRPQVIFDFAAYTGTFYIKMLSIEEAVVDEPPASAEVWLGPRVTFTAPGTYGNIGDDYSQIIIVFDKEFSGLYVEVEFDCDSPLNLMQRHTGVPWTSDNGWGDITQNYGVHSPAYLQVAQSDMNAVVINNGYITSLSGLKVKVEGNEIPLIQNGRDFENDYVYE